MAHVVEVGVRGMGAAVTIKVWVIVMVVRKEMMVELVGLVC